MGKKKKKKNNVVQKPPKLEPKSKRKALLGLGLAGIVLATVTAGGIIKSCYEREKDSVSASQMYGMESNKKWLNILNEEGVFVSEEELQNKYEIFRENARINEASGEKKKKLEKILFQKLDGVSESFKENPVPEMYNENFFYTLWSTTHNHQRLLLSSNKIANIFKLYQGNPLVTELFNNLPKTDGELVGKNLNCSTLLVHKKLERRGVLPGETIDKFIARVRKNTARLRE